MIRHTEKYKPRSWLLGSIADMFLMAQPHARHRSSQGGRVGENKTQSKALTEQNAVAQCKAKRREWSAMKTQTMRRSPLELLVGVRFVSYAPEVRLHNANAGDSGSGWRLNL